MCGLGGKSNVLSESRGKEGSGGKRGDGVQSRAGEKPRGERWQGGKEGPSCHCQGEGRREGGVWCEFCRGVEARSLIV